MTQVSFPRVTTNVSGAITNVGNVPQKILVVSQKLAAGTAVAGDLNENIEADASTLAGVGSLGEEIVRAVRAVNQESQVDAIFLDEAGAAVAAAGIINFTGSTATEAGSLTVIIGSERNHSLSIAVASGDTATAIGDTLVTAITADTTILVTAVNTTGSVALTAKNKGTVGNEIAIEVRGAVAGVSSIVLTAMASGATDPVFTGVFDVIDGERYQTILWTWASDVSPLTTLVDARFNVTDDILDGLGYVGEMDTLTNLTTTIGLLNSFINYLAVKTENLATMKGPASVELPATMSAYAGALRALKLTDGAAIGDLNAGSSGSDSTGGPALASRPLANTPVFPMAPEKKGRGWSKLDIVALKAVGGSIMGNNIKGNQVALGEQLTTRTTFGGNPDDSFKFVNFYDTSVNIREFFTNNLKSRYAQMRMTDGSPVPGRPMVNIEQFTAALIEFYVTLSGPDFALTRSGEANLSFFTDALNLIVSFNIQTGVITWSCKAPINTQVREINGAIEIVFAIVSGVIGEDEEEENPEDPEEP